MSAPRTKLFVGHLPDGCTNDDLFNLFSKYGNVKECDVINKYGFVHMSTPEEAQDALKALNNYYFRGSSLSVEPSKSKLHPEPGSQGRARGGSSRGRGYGGPRGGGGYANGYSRRYDGPPFGGRDYYDRAYSSMSARMRPYPSPYDRPSPSMGPMRDDYVDPYSPSLRDPYSSRTGMSPMSRDLYERRATTYPSASDYLYSRRSPTSSMDVGRSYWYNDSMGDSRRGYGDPLGDDGYANGYSRKYDGPSYREPDYYDHADSSMPAPRRPYPSSYDRSNPSVGVRDDYADPYSSRSGMPPPMSRDLYERGASTYPSDADDLYSRRPPASSMDLGRMRMPSSVGPRPYY